MEIDIEFKHILDMFLEHLWKSMSDDEIRVFLKSKKGKAEFEVYCTACIKLQAKNSLEGDKNEERRKVR